MEEARGELETLEVQGTVRRLVRRGGELWEMRLKTVGAANTQSGAGVNGEEPTS